MCFNFTSQHYEYAWTVFTKLLKNNSISLDNKNFQTISLFSKSERNLKFFCRLLESNEKILKNAKNSSWQIMSSYNNCISNYIKCQISVLNQTSAHSDISQNKPVRLFQIWADWQCLHLADTAIGQCHDRLQQEMFHWIC